MSTTPPTGEAGHGKVARLLVAGLFVAVGALVFQQSWTTLAADGAASGGAMQNAAMYPEWVATALLVLTAIQIGRIVLGLEHDGATTPIAWSLRFKMLAATVGMVVYLGLLRPAGYHIATPLFLAYLLVLLELRRPILVPVLALSISLAVAFCFERLLNVALPVGVLELSL